MNRPQGGGFGKPFLPAGFDPSKGIPSWLAKIKPNYQEIRKRYLIICLVSAIAIFLLEYIMFVLYSLDPDAYGGFKTSIPVYLVLYNIIPTLINVVALVSAWMVSKRHSNEMLQNYAPIFAMTVICTVAASAHCVYSITMAVLCLPIFMSSIFGSKQATYLTSILCAIGLAIAVVCRYFNDYNIVDLALLPETIAGYTLLIVSCLLSLVVIELFNSQKVRMMDVAYGAELAREEAQKANATKSDFLASMSHEIRTPLNAIIGMTEVIFRRTKEPETREYASDALQASNALLAIIGDIIDISKIESGKLELHEENYELGSLINDSYNMVATRIADKGLTAKVLCDESLPRMLYGDEYHLRQIIVNLLSNAVKYTDDGEVMLKVAGIEDDAILRLEVTVKDTGIGIKPEDISSLFIKFSRLDDVKERKIEGVGLGLSIAKHLVELMGGTLDVESEYGVGSTFVVRVPQAIVDHAPIGDIYATYLDVHGELSKYQRSFTAPEASILVVDDVSNNLQVIERLLADTNVSVDTASSGAICLEKVTQRPYDLILMDHMMPGLDGVQTLRAMKALDSSLNDDTPVVMLTANAMLNAREEYMELGFVDYLAKPVRGARLENMLIRHLPSEKVHIEEGDEKTTDAVPADKADSPALVERLDDAVDELDVHMGLMYCAEDAGFYCSMIEDFASSNYIDHLQGHFDAQDWDAFRIDAHTIKNLARTIGLPALSDEAYGLETAAKELDIERINELHPQVVEHFHGFADAVRPLLGT